MSLIHDAKLPYSFNSCRWRRGFNPDLMFVSNNIANQCEKVVLDPIPHSQHRPIGLRAVNTSRTVPFRRRFNLKKTHWGNFAKDTDSYIQDLSALPTHYDTFVEMLKRSSMRNIPRGCGTTYTPGLTDDSTSAGVVSLPKDPRASLINSANYTTIALYSSMGKIGAMLISDRYSIHLMTSKCTICF